MSSDHFPNDAKVFDIDIRAFHRIGAPHYDVAVDQGSGVPSARRGAKRAPSGLARESGARGPEAFQDSGLLAKVTVLLAKLAKGALKPIPGLNFIPFLDDLIGKLTGKPPLEALSEALGKLISAAVEGALFARYLRSIPAWVPVGRKGYENEFTYTEDDAPRTVTKEEEREIEGRLVGSYPLCNDTVFTQWDHFRHWAFHVQPAPGFRYLVGRGNVPDPNEQKFMKDFDARPDEEAYRAAVTIYGQKTTNEALDTGALECLMDIGAISKPIADGGSHGVMFDAKWPYWPMTGDHFWATGRWAYDCMRAVGEGKGELFPTQINPIKAFAAARFEGFKFSENAQFVPASRFFFFATSEGGHTEFRTSIDRNSKTHESGITLGDRDYTFLVDLPPIDVQRADHAIGGTIGFPLNRIVLRPRLLVDIKRGPFGVGLSSPFADGISFASIQPIIEVLRPSDASKAPTQARITIPLSQLPAPSDPKQARAVGVDIALGWHDPNEEEARKLFRVTVQVRRPAFVSQSGNVRLATAINGQWGLFAGSVSSTSEPKTLPAVPSPVIHERVMLLHETSRVYVASNGIWRHGFGEFIEGTTLADRRLKVGPLFDVDPATKKKLKDFLADAKKTIADIKKLGDDVKNPKALLKAELQKKLDDLRQQGAPQKAIDEMQKEIDRLVDGLPDTPDALKSALDAMDKQLSLISDALGAVEDFLKLTDELIGENHFPGWHEDIDAAIETGVKESVRVSAIARSMFLHPTPIVNRADEPLGWVEFVSNARTPLGRATAGDMFDIGTDSSIVATLRATLESSKQKTLRLRMRANRFSIVGSGNNLGEQISPPQSKTDYEFELNVQIEPQVR